MSEITTRKATPADLAALFALWQEQGIIEVQLDPRLANLRPESNRWHSQMRKRLRLNQDESPAEADEWVVIAERDDQIIGFIRGMIDETPGGDNNVGLVSELVVDPHNGHGGTGSALLDALKAWFAEHDVQTLIVRVPRHVAVQQAFWRAKGATIVQEVMTLRMP